MLRYWIQTLTRASRLLRWLGIFQQVTVISRTGFTLLVGVYGLLVFSGEKQLINPTTNRGSIRSMIATRTVCSMQRHNVCIYAHIFIHTHANTRAHTRTHAQHTHTRMQKHMQAHTHTHIYTYKVRTVYVYTLDIQNWTTVVHLLKDPRSWEDKA